MSLTVAMGQVGYALGGGLAGPLYTRLGFGGDTLLGALVLVGASYVVGFGLPEPDLAGARRCPNLRVMIFLVISEISYISPEEGRTSSVEIQRLSDLEQLLLLSVLQAGEDVHAGAIQEVLEQRGERPASLGSIYVTMTRLEERGMVESTMGASTPERGGKAKRLYRVTQDGLLALHHTRRVMERMWEGLPAPDGRAGP
jgi:DNA-binding PadR family transcriptional regulator